MKNTKNKLQEGASFSTKRNRSDGLWGFFILTYVLMLLTWGVLAIFQMGVASSTSTDAPTSPLAMSLYFLGGFTPSIAGFVMAYRQHGRAGLRDLWKRSIQFNLGGKWYLAIISIPLIVQVGTGLIFKVQGGDFVRPEFLDQPVLMIVLVISIFVGGALLEEFGWRGFAQDRVLARWGVVRGSLILGMMWAPWHLPLFFVPGTGQQQMGNPVLMFFAYAVQVVSFSILFSWIYSNTRRSIWGAMLFHFMINFSATMMIYIAEVSMKFMYFTNAGMYLLLAVIFVLFTREKTQPAVKESHLEYAD